MQDEQFMRQWNAGHGHFTADLDGGLRRLASRLRRPFRSAARIGRPYGGIVRGLAAAVITAGFWTTVMALATPSPTYAAPLDAGVAAGSDCRAGVILA